MDWLPAQTECCSALRNPPRVLPLVLLLVPALPPLPPLPFHFLFGWRAWPVEQLQPNSSQQAAADYQLQGKREETSGEPSIVAPFESHMQQIHTLLTTK